MSIATLCFWSTFPISLCVFASFPGFSCSLYCVRTAAVLRFTALPSEQGTSCWCCDAACDRRQPGFHPGLLTIPLSFFAEVYWTRPGFQHSPGTCLRNVLWYRTITVRFERTSSSMWSDRGSNIWKQHIFTSKKSIMDQIVKLAKFEQMGQAGVRQTWSLKSSLMTWYHLSPDVPSDICIHDGYS